jgi:hypothetical protein
LPIEGARDRGWIHPRGLGPDGKAVACGSCIWARL